MTVLFGEKIKVEIYGTSHGPCVGLKMSGVPSGLPVDLQKLQDFLTRRAPGRNAWSTTRKEDDVPEFLSGLDQEAITNGDVIEAVIHNRNVRPSDYDNGAVIPRPGHADYPAWVKYGVIESGGGAFSARLTAALCIAGGLCIQWLQERGIEVKAHVHSIGDIVDASMMPGSYVRSVFPVIDAETGEEMQKLIDEVKEAGDSIGGSIECMITGLDAGIGSPLFGNMESRICQAVFAVPAVKGIEFGAGFKVSSMKGSENNDPYIIEEGKVLTETNNHGGILGGLTSGMPVVFRTAMKPTPSIAMEQSSVDLENMEQVRFTVRGRHDPCIVPRAVPCIEAAAALAVWDMIMEEESQ